MSRRPKRFANAPAALVLPLAGMLVLASTPAVAADQTIVGDPASVNTSATGLAALGATLERWVLALRTATQLSETMAQRPPAPAGIVRSGPRSSGAVALTFDDGFNRDACARIASTLRNANATGTFFINGNHLKAAPKQWRGILRGMQVGNHTRSHRLLTRETDRVVTKQIRENEDLHERILGRPMLKVLRPPYGASDRRVRRLAAGLGYDRIVLWSLDSFDWKRSSSPRDITRRVTGARPGSVILMHCSRGATAKALPGIIRHYQARGIELAGLDEVIGR